MSSYFIPKTPIGDIFFGRFAPFYNPAVARFFYFQAIANEQKEGIPPPYAHYQASRTYFIEGNLEQALIDADKELEYYPEHFHTHYIKGLTLGYMDREREATESFAKFLESKPESWAARNDKAWLHFRIGEIDLAMETILPAAQNNPNNPWVMNTFGVLLMNQGSLPEAEKALTQALTLAESMTEEDWGRAYPGNSPSVYDDGLLAMRASIGENLIKVKALLQNER